MGRMHTRSPNSLKENLHRLLTPPRLLFVFVCFNLVLGLLIAHAYGESTDEAFERQRADLALHMYAEPGDPDAAEMYLAIGNKRFYGTGQTMLFQWAETKLGPVLGTSYGTISHYLYFVSFQVAVVSLFYLMTHFTGQWTALAVSVLFGTQPLLFGHAFINPKDVPLMAIFIAVVAVGFGLAARLESYYAEQHKPLSQLFANLKRTVQDGLFPKLKQLRGWGLAFLAVLALRLLVNPLLSAVVTAIYQASLESLAGRAFRAVGGGSGSVPLADYIHKAQVLAGRGVNYVLLAFGLVLLFILLRKTRFRFSKHGWAQYWQEIKAMPPRMYIAILLAGAVWGFAVSTRVIGLAAGGIVGLYLLLRFRHRAIYPLVLYTLAAAVVCFATWPYLWVFGLPGFIESLVKFSAYTWQGNVLFEGQIFPTGTLPRDYMLKLVVLQFTAPLVVLALGGMVLSMVRLFRRQMSGLKAFILFAWLVLPVAYTVLRNTVQYDNFRQYLFVMVPLFVFAGLALEWLAGQLKHRYALLALSVLAILPGVVALVQLHPYQYIYYNAFTGGVQGAFREYELDYWLTSYQEAAEWMDGHVPEGSSILVWGGERRVTPYVEHEYTYYNPNKVDESSYDSYDYVLITTEYQLDLQYHLSAETVYAVERDGVPLVLVKRNP